MTYRPRPLRWSYPGAQPRSDFDPGTASPFPILSWWWCRPHPCRTARRPPWTRRSVPRLIGRPKTAHRIDQQRKNCCSAMQHRLTENGRLRWQLSVRRWRSSKKYARQNHHRTNENRALPAIAFKSDLPLWCEQMKITSGESYVALHWWNRTRRDAADNCLRSDRRLLYRMSRVEGGAVCYDESAVVRLWHKRVNIPTPPQLHPKPTPKTRKNPPKTTSTAEKTASQNLTRCSGRVNRIISGN